MKENRLHKDGWNWYAFIFNIIWYFKHGIIDKAIMMLVIILFSLGVGIIPVAIYCGLNGNEDRFRTNIKKMV